tara:strand:+ start:358 stop:1146 length:789 start_codon:yes stop_codon:yes gene_type:complete
MFIVCNGTFKSGSSWLHAIVVKTCKVKNIKLSSVPNYYNPDINSPTRVLEENISSFLQNEDIVEKNYITKAHYFKRSTLNRSYTDSVKFIFIERDIKDAIVSHFYHFKRLKDKNINFATYFNSIGIFKAYEMYLFNKRCKQNFPHRFFFSFEGLKLDFSNSLNRLCKLLCVTELTNDEILSIKESTSFSKMKNIANEGYRTYYPAMGRDSHKLFRKGNIGDWQEYFSDKQLKRINTVIEGETTFFIKFGYFVFFTLRRRIGI